LLASPPKDSRLSTAEPCALYYFPEIPSGTKKDNEAASTTRCFTSGSFKGNDNRASQKTDGQTAEQVQSLIKEAFNKGLEQGRAEMIAGHHDNINNAVAALEASMHEMQRIRQRDVEYMEVETVRLAVAIAKKVIGNQTEHQAVIQHVVKQAMQKVNDTRHLVIKLNPKDLDAVHDLRQELMPADDFGTVFRIEADEGVQRGGCVIETKLGDVDARIDTQIKIIEELLVDQLPK
jgi:flagellar biosynthesis/type III secretory pathway protein FliH